MAKEQDVLVREHCYTSKVYTGKDGKRRVVFVEKDGDEWKVTRRLMRSRAIAAEIYRSKNRLYLHCLPEDQLPTIVEEAEDEVALWLTALERYFRVNPTHPPVEGGLLPITFKTLAEILEVCGLKTRYPYLSKPEKLARRVPAAYLMGKDRVAWAQTLAARVDGLEAVARDLAEDPIGISGRAGRFYDNLLRCVNSTAPATDTEPLLLWET